MNKLLLMAFCGLLLTGCTSVSSLPNEKRVVVTKTRALSPDEQKVIQDSVKEHLKDPMSAVFKMPPINEDGAPEIYCGKVNAKNSYGGYVGDTTFMATVSRNEGVVISSFAMMPDSAQYGDIVLLGMCAQKGYLL